MALNVDTEKRDSERRTKMWIWTPNKTKHGSERQTKTDNYERQAKEDDSERNRWEDIVALNVELRNDQRLWTPKNNDTSECRNETTTLNAKPKETSMNANLKQKLCIPD